MVALGSTASVFDAVVTRLAATYGQLPPALAACDPRTLEAALRFSGGNTHRLTAEPDGSIIVWNHCVW